MHGTNVLLFYDYDGGVQFSSRQTTWSAALKGLQRNGIWENRLLD
jgi:hypothetical protein